MDFVVRLSQAAIAEHIRLLSLMVENCEEPLLEMGGEEQAGVRCIYCSEELYFHFLQTGKYNYWHERRGEQIQHLEKCAVLAAREHLGAWKILVPDEVSQK